MVASKYIKINKKPVIGIYEPLKIKNLEEMIYSWRIKARERGIGELFILANLNIYPFKNFQKLYLIIFQFLEELC